MTQEKKMDKRTWLKVVGGTAAGLVVGATAAYLAKPEPAAVKETVTRTTTETVARTATVTATPTVKPEYTFYFCSHLGPWDMAMNWITESIDAISKLLPVQVIYLNPTDQAMRIEEQVANFETAMHAEPDGIVVSIFDSAAFDEPVRRATEIGIPVIAFNMEDTRPEPEKMPYLTYVGGDEILCGYEVAKRSFELLEPWKAKRAVAALIAPGHPMIEARAQGMRDACAEYGVTYDGAALDVEPSKCYELMRAYLETHKDTDFVFVEAAAWGPYIARAIDEVGLKDQVKLALVDESPMCIEGIVKGDVVATHSQGFFLQGYLPIFWLYVYNKYGYAPAKRTLTGPIVIDKTNVEAWKARVMKSFGEEKYEELAVPIYP